MTKLTDTQLIVLSKAAARHDGAAAVPAKLNAAGAAKVGSSLIGRKLMREVRSKPGMPVWRKDEEERSISLIITRAGREAIGIEEEAGEPVQTSVMQQPEPARRTGKKENDKAAHQRQSTGAFRSGSKQALVIQMLSNKQGATLEALVEATGWLPHSTRAALTGLRKRGFVVERMKDENKGSIYRITSHPKSAAA